MPSSSKDALERKRVNNMNRARVKALKAFLSRPWVKQKLHEALSEFKNASYKRLCDAVADVSLQSHKRFDELHEKNRKLRGQLSKETQKAQDQDEQVKQLQKENQRLAKENKQQGELLEKQQAELDTAQAALKVFRTKQGRFLHWATPKDRKRWAWLTMDPAKWVSRGNSSLRDGCMGMQ